MKIRESFVSNSSSSSYIVIGSESPEFPDKLNEKVLDYSSHYGETEFGWEVDDHTCLYDRINFAWIQAESIGSKWNPEIGKSVHTRSQEMDLLEETIKEAFGVQEIKWNMSTNFEPRDVPKDPKISYYCYIDHQSSGGEGKNMEMFKSKESLIQFLFAPDSYIHTDNDNY